MQSLSYVGPSTWNKLPNDLKTANSINCFTHKIKKYFFQKLGKTETDIFIYAYLFIKRPTQPTFHSYFKEYFRGEYHMYHSSSYTHLIISRKFQPKQTWWLMKAIAEMKLDTEHYDEIGVAVENWLWVRVELMAW